MAIEKIKITVLNVNVTYYPIFKTPQHTQDIKLFTTHQSYRAAQKTVAEGKIKKFLILLDIRSSSTILMSTLTPTLK